MIFLIDFDRTISKQCSCTAMIERFRTIDTSDIEEQWERGLLSTPTATEQIFKRLEVDEEQLVEQMRKVEIDPFFEEFLSFCKKYRCDYAIVSDGFSLLISTILHTRIKDFADNPIRIFANQLVYCDSSWKASFPYYSEETPNLGVCKSQIVKQYQKEGKVAFIGDGFTDYQAAEVSDYVFAKDKLALYCQERQIPYYPYGNFKDIIQTCLEEKLVT